MEKVCITGIGLLTSLTQSVEQFANLVSAETPFYSRIKLPREPHHKEYPAAIINLKTASIPPDSNLRKMGRASVFALAALDNCLKHSTLDKTNLPDLGLLIATQSGEINHIEDYYLSFMKDGPKGASAFYFPNTVLNSIGGFLSIHFGLKSFNHTFSSRETTGIDTIEYASTLIAQGCEERILVVGTEEISPASLKGFDDIGLLARYENTTLSEGLIMAEGACALLLESESAAIKRKTKIHGIIEQISRMPIEPGTYTKAYPFTKYTGEFFGASGVFAAALACLLRPEKTLIESSDFTGKVYNMCVKKP